MADQFITIEKHEDFAIATIKREPVNSMNTALWQQLNAALADIEEDPKMRGLVFRSGLDKDVFTAGNDLFELYAPKSSEAQYRDFWVAQTSFFARLYQSRLATLALIRGACPAGGCALALCCDYRIMTDFGNIGLNEVAIGIPVPKYWSLLMERTIGLRSAESLLLKGLMPSASEALALGLVDELSSKEGLDEKGLSAMKAMLSVADSGRVATKRHLRESFAKAWGDFAEEEAKYGWNLISHPKVVAAIEATLAKLGSKS